MVDNEKQSVSPEAQRHDRVIDAIFRGDELSAVIVAMTYIEFYLRAMVLLRLPHPERLGKNAGGLQFHNMLKFALALSCINPNMRRCLETLAQIRNDFAHDIDHALSKAQVQTLYNHLPEEMKISADKLKRHYPEDDYTGLMRCILILIVGQVNNFYLFALDELHKGVKVRDVPTALRLRASMKRLGVSMDTAQDDNTPE